MEDHLVAAGDCLSSIADNYGFFWQTLWEHPRNATLKAKRKEPNTLMPGDTVHIPDKRLKTESCHTGQQHRFRVKGVPVKLRLRLLYDDEPRADEAFTLDVNGILTHGTTDGGGKLEVTIPPQARTGKLVVGSGERETVYHLNLGDLNPHDEISGVQGRLNNLGYTQVPVDGVFNEETKQGLAAFQAVMGLPVTGELDATTIAKLRESDEGS